jgi:uncharacterized phage protein gp47/JayE
MFEDKNAEAIQQEMLNNIDDSFEKSAGYILYETIKSFAIEVSKLYQGMSSVASKVDVDKLTDSDLTKFVYQRKGINRKLATKATGILTVTGTGSITKGDLFETASGTQFVAIETKAITATGTVNLEAVAAGTSGNVGASTITQMPITIQGIISVTNTAPTHDGYEAETDARLRERYYSALRQPATSANKYAYINWAKEVNGIGNAKCVPLWSGANTVKVIIINSLCQPASSELVAAAQTYIDPAASGTGQGQAPIGAYCTVASATNKSISVSVKINRLDAYSDLTVKTNIQNKITQYLQDIAFSQDYVSYAKIGSLILEAEGVKDYTTLLLNNVTANIAVGNEEIATISEVVLTP